MTNEEAYEWIYTHFAPCGDGTKQDAAITMALGALSMRIPKKLKITTSQKRCSRCNKLITTVGCIKTNYGFCRHCGQAIDWS